MSTSQINTTPVLSECSPIAVANVRTRTPTLPAKYSKFIQFSYFLIKHIINNNQNESVLDEAQLFELSHTFSDINVQQTFIEGFLSNSKTINKDIKDYKTMIKKTAIANAKANDKLAKQLLKEQNKPARQPRARAPKKEKVVENGLITELVQLANNISLNDAPSTIPIVETLPIPIVDVVETLPIPIVAVVETPILNKPKVVKEKVVKEKVIKEKVIKEKVVKEKVVKEKVVKPKVIKEKVVKNKIDTPKLLQVSPELQLDQPLEGDDNSEYELSLKTIEINGTEYFIDDDNNVYNVADNIGDNDAMVDENDVKIIGKYNPSTNNLTMSLIDPKTIV